MKNRIIDEIALVLADFQDNQQELISAGEEDLAVQLQAEVIEPLEELAMDIDSQNLPEEDEEEVEGEDDGEELEEEEEEEESDASFRDAARKKIKIKKSRSGPKLKWICCKEPKKGRTRKGIPVWLSFCKFKKGNKLGGMTRVLRSGKQKKPNVITLGGKKMKKC